MTPSTLGSQPRHRAIMPSCMTHMLCQQLKEKNASTQRTAGPQGPAKLQSVVAAGALKLWTKSFPEPLHHLILTES